MTRTATLGVCYYPEHWPESQWADDARRMVELGIRIVRIGEFAWTRLEPTPGEYRFEWLDRAIETLGGAGLKIVLGTPTTTPPKWLIDQMPDMIAYDREGRPRGFGSRRHYDFSHEGYRREVARITEVLAKRYGQNPHIMAWQLDNEYGCHDTIRSYSPVARRAFQDWLRTRYGTIDALNQAWGTVFWSMELRDFDEAELPNLTVTEANPSAWLDFYRFASDQVVSFNKLKADILRRHAPGQDLSHNYMGFITEFDHFKVAGDLDFATWDSYPLGFTDTLLRLPPEERQRWQRTGHPDIAAFHHDLYRAVGRGRWWVMEQQPGPVNWAFHNPAPLPGMVRLWTWEAFAHGAEVVTYFRWRQVPFAQEQMHAGLLRPDSEPAPGYAEAGAVAVEAASLPMPETDRAPVAILFDYAADWLLTAHPQGREYSFKHLVFDWYQAVRRLGLDVDFVSPDGDLSGYRLILAPAAPMVSDALAARLTEAVAGGATLVLGPRAGSKTENLHIPANLPPGTLADLAGFRVERVESLDPAFAEPVPWHGETYQTRGWREATDGSAKVLATFSDGWPALREQRHGAGRVYSWHGLPDGDFLRAVLAPWAEAVGLTLHPVPETVRLRRRGALTFAFNYGSDPWHGPAEGVAGVRYRIGSARVLPQQVAAWERSASHDPEGVE